MTKGASLQIWKGVRVWSVFEASRTVACTEGQLHPLASARAVCCSLQAMTDTLSVTLCFVMDRFLCGWLCQKSMAAVQKFQDDTADLGGAVKSGRFSSIAYTVLTAGFFAAGISYLYAPETTLQVGSWMHQQCRRCCSDVNLQQHI